MIFNAIYMDELPPIPFGQNVKHNQPYEVKLLTNITWINHVQWTKNCET